ncbi:hypothetical protein SAMN05216357_11644 [Porphyromonadaceae bacterium KH3CP3RA]|nr:hypothetical protein SAMN05216357_11644 [Porphyromonadaceae bacterium KH3CP3RA]
MATMLIEYDEHNLFTEQILQGLSSAGIIKIKEKTADKRIDELKESIRQAKKMGEDMRENGLKGYQTMDEFLQTI